MAMMTTEDFIRNLKNKIKERDNARAELIHNAREYEPLLAEALANYFKGEDDLVRMVADQTIERIDFFESAVCSILFREERE
jgi:hypothetical protein